ncbi:MAG: sporulation integral membrane protein YtvI [Clostridiales bacterium]|nr:sporulation integral membrane protein YtvI [Clostridiales bacterium]
MKLWESISERTRFIIRLIIIALSVYLSFRFVLPLVLPFVFSYILAWIVRPITEFLYRKVKLPRIVGGSVSLILLVILIVTGMFYLGNILIQQAINFARNLPIYLNILAGKLDSICSSCDEILGLAAGSVRSTLDDNIIKMVDRVKSNLIPGMTTQTLSLTIKIIGFIGTFLITIISAVLIVKELPEFREKYKNTNIYNDINKVTSKLADTGIGYLRSQLLVMVMVAVCCVTGLVVIRNDYALLLGIGIALMDALPFIGSGIVFIPWSIIMLLNGDIFGAAVLLTTYLVCQIIREVIEPKLIGNRIGIKPLYTLMAMYIGLKLFGIAGFILGPVGLVIIITIIKVVNSKGTKTYSLDKGFDLE